VRDSVDLSAYSGQAGVTISFANKGDYGQFLYLDDFLIQGQDVTGFQENAAPAIQLFPNPANETVYIRSDQSLSNDFIITDVLGRLVATVKPTGQLTEIAVSGWAKGAYFVTVNDLVFKVEKY